MWLTVSYKPQLQYLIVITPEGFVRATATVLCIATQLPAAPRQSQEEQVRGSGGATNDAATSKDRGGRGSAAAGPKLRWNRRRARNAPVPRAM